MELHLGGKINISRSAAQRAQHRSGYTEDTTPSSVRANNKPQHLNSQPHMTLRNSCKTKPSYNQEKVSNVWYVQQYNSAEKEPMRTSDTSTSPFCDGRGLRASGIPHSRSALSSAAWASRTGNPTRSGVAAFAPALITHRTLAGLTRQPGWTHA